MAASKHHRWAEIEPEQMNPLDDAAVCGGHQHHAGPLVLKKGAHVPLHSHFHEQISHVVEGALNSSSTESDVRCARARFCAFRRMCRMR